MDVQFYSKVLHEATSDEYLNGGFLCIMSETFEAAWEGDKQDSIKKDGQAFLTNTKSKSKIGDSLLFDQDEERYERRFDIRMAFLNWAIKNPQHLS